LIIFTIYFKDYQISDEEIGGYGKMYAFILLIRKPEDEQNRWENNIKMDLSIIGWSVWI
jgi:hypothetical protein